MSRTTAVNFGGALQFPYATAAADLFKKEDVQTLAQAVDQHDHSSGKGLGVSGTGIKTAIDMPDWFRSTGHTTAFPGTGTGVEMFWDATNGGSVQAYNRGGAVYAPMSIVGSTLNLQIGATPAITINANRDITTQGTIWPSASPSIHFASGATMSDYQSGGQAYVQVSQMTITPGVLAAASMNCNGPLIVAGATTLQTTLSVASTVGHNAGLTQTGDITMGASAAMRFSTGGYVVDGGGGYVSANKLTVDTLATNNVAMNGQVSTGVNAAFFIARSAPTTNSGGITYGGELGQGNGAMATLTAVKGTGFGPTNAPAVGWIRAVTGGTSIYWPYWV